MTRDERGLSESTQWAVLMPSIILVILAALQVGLTWHAQHVAQQAADAAAETAAVVRGSAGEARAVAGRVAASGDLRDVSVAVDVGRTVRVSVSGRAFSFLPAGAAQVTAVSELPLEPR